MTELTRIGVVVPAHNEQTMLAGCLAALQTAARLVSLPTRILVVLDDCTDRTSDICDAFRVETCRIAARNVGKARATGMRALLKSEFSLESLWLASTDADTCVEPNWLSHQVELAGSGADVVLGIVQIDDEVVSGHGRRSFEADYQERLSADGTHHHVHGANLGLRASVYLRAGGFPPVANHEDHGLVRELRQMKSVTIAACQRLAVRTSGRLDARCHDGFGATLNRYAIAQG
jgi:glycosyltransferase involved in cell wall biosynthesis